MKEAVLDNSIPLGWILVLLTYCLQRECEGGYESCVHSRVKYIHVGSNLQGVGASGTHDYTNRFT